MIQILGLRLWKNASGEEKKIDKFFDQNWKAPSVIDLFENLEKYLAPIPQGEKWNLYYTAAECTEKKREIKIQRVIPFDIDGMEIEDQASGFTLQGVEFPPAPINPEYLSVVCEALGVNLAETGVVFSGNGLQFLIGLTDDLCFTTTEYFDENRHHYKALCNRINLALAKASLPGKADTTVFSAARVLRLPLTANRKPGKTERMALLLQKHIVPTAYDIRLKSGVPVVAPDAHVTPEQFKKYPRPDGEGILDPTSGCAFISSAKKNPRSLSEPGWYAMLSVLGRLPEGNKLAHEYSQGHPNYSHAETEEKLQQALSVSGPRTCANIETLWDGCKACPNYQKVNSPISIRGPNYIRTIDNGFHDYHIQKDGTLKQGKPNYEDLRRFFEQSHTYKILGDSRICYVWKDTHYQELGDAYLETFAQTHFKPTANTEMVGEFRRLVQRTNLYAPQWWDDTTHRRMNFQNGTLDLATMEFEPGHDPKLGFRYVLTYDYDPKALSPVFDKFLGDITGGDASLSQVLMEFAGYALSNDACWTQKAMILEGEGANGKSTFMDVLKLLTGKDNYTALSLSDLKSEGNRQMIDGKLLNIAEETPSRSLMESSVFKNMVTGGELPVRQIYKKPYLMRNRAKMLFACNELPGSYDTSEGFFRRFIIVPFRMKFTDELGNKDPFILEKLTAELPGILNKVLGAYQVLLKKRTFSQSEKIREGLAAYTREVDSVLAWFEENVTTHPLDLDPKQRGSFIKDLYSSYAGDTKANEMKPVNAVAFRKKIARLIPDYKDRLTDRRTDKSHGSFLRCVTHLET